MTKHQLVEEIIKIFPQYSKREADIIVSSIFDSMKDALIKGDRIELRGFGAFATKYQAARQAHNPKTGEAVLVPGKRVPFFKASKEMHHRLNREGQTEKG